MPRVSVVMPAYNRASYIGEAIQSVLDQTYPDFELIAVDDGSADNTAEVVARFKDNRITYIHQANAGETAARNTGIAHASGELLGFLDSDDRMLPNALQVMAGLLDARPDIDVAYGWFYMMDEDGLPINEVHGCITGDVPPQLDRPWPGINVPLSGTTLEGKILTDLILEPEGTLAIGGAVVRRACVEAINGFDPTRKHQGHWDFYLRLARGGRAFACTRQGVMVVRIHSGGAHKNSAAMYASRLDILERMFGDAELQEVLAPVRPLAYFKTHHAFMRKFYFTRNWENGAKALNEAMKCAPLSEEDIRFVADMVSHLALSNEAADPVAFVNRALVSITDQPATLRIRDRALGILDMELARRAHAESTAGG